MAFKKMIESHHLERPPSNGILEEDVMESPNEFSSSTYRVINFIVDVPVRIDKVIEQDLDDGLGRVVFVMAEFPMTISKLRSPMKRVTTPMKSTRNANKYVKQRLQYGQHIRDRD